MARQGECYSIQLLFSLLNLLATDVFQNLHRVYETPPRNGTVIYDVMSGQSGTLKATCKSVKFESWIEHLNLFFYWEHLNPSCIFIHNCWCGL
jgi:hypothetical protein